jgi:hypothetical protein
MKWLVIISALILIGIGIAVIYSKNRWRINTDTRRAKLASGQQIIKPSFYTEAELEGLPTPVQRFFRKVLNNGQPIITTVKLTQQGQFNMGETEAKWSPFTATQIAISQRPGFDWDAYIQIVPSINIFVHDTYLLEEGNLHASLLGLFTLANMSNTPELNQGELLRFFAETAWYPTALLPSQGVRWEAIDYTSARGTLTDGAITASLVFRFNSEGMIDSIRADARYGNFGGKMIAMPWAGRFCDYTVQHGMSIPLKGEVEWERPDGAWLYYKGQVTAIDYEFAS